jgi:hypothetical protein
MDFFEFFLVLSALFLFFSFISHIVMKRMPLERMFSFLERKACGLGNIVSSLIGAVTPFCVCTTIPIFTTMIQMGVKTNVAVSFLLSSPLLSISAAVLLVFLFGVKFSVYYAAAAVFFSILGGLLVRWLRFDNEISDKLANNLYIPGHGGPPAYRQAAHASFRLFRDLFIPLLIGAVIAGYIHNYVPVKAVEAMNGFPGWVVIPLVALLGFPLYSNIMVIAPICFALANKGVSQGAIITFMMSGAGISLPTVIVLSSLFKLRLFIFYLLYTFFSYCIIGIIFDWVR